jgi:hypothetical protein
MESISKSGKIFTGKFAETAVKIGLANPIEEGQDNVQGETPAQNPDAKKQVKGTRGRKPNVKK